MQKDRGLERQKWRNMKRTKDTSAENERRVNQRERRKGEKPDGKNNRGEKDRCEEKQKGRKIWLGKDRGRERRVENGTGEKRR